MDSVRCKWREELAAGTGQRVVREYLQQMVAVTARAEWVLVPEQGGKGDVGGVLEGLLSRMICVGHHWSIARRYVVYTALPNHSLSSPSPEHAIELLTLLLISPLTAHTRGLEAASRVEPDVGRVNNSGHSRASVRASGRCTAWHKVVK